MRRREQYCTRRDSKTDEERESSEAIVQARRAYMVSTTTILQMWFADY